MIGPVQVLVLGYEEPHFSGEAVAEARRLEDAGIVRVVDVLVVAREASGALDVLEVEGMPDGEIAKQLFAAGVADAPAEAVALGWSLADAVPASGVAVVVLLEHLWARGLVDAIGRSGGRPMDEFWLGEQDRLLLEQMLAER